jgi:hypothetical protein
VTTEAKVEAVALSIKPAVFYVRVSDDPARISASTGFPSYSCVAVVTLAEHEQIVARHAAAITALEGEVERARIAGIDACDKLTMLWQKDIDRADAAERLLNEVREIQRSHYGDGVGLHLAMIRWAHECDALTNETP